MDMILKYTSSKDILGFLAAATQPVAVHVTSTLTRTLCIWLTKDRSSVRKWPAYVFTLLQKAAVSVCRSRQHTCVANAGARFRIDFWFYISVFASCQFDPALGEEMRERDQDSCCHVQFASTCRVSKVFFVAGTTPKGRRIYCVVSEHTVELENGLAFLVSRALDFAVPVLLMRH